MFNLLHFVSRAQITVTTCSCGGNGESINCAGHKIELHKLKHTGIIESGQVKMLNAKKNRINGIFSLPTYQFQRVQILQHQQVRGLPLQKRYHVFFEELQKVNRIIHRVLKLQKDSGDGIRCVEKSS